MDRLISLVSIRSQAGSLWVKEHIMEQHVLALFNLLFAQGCDLTSCFFIRNCFYRTSRQEQQFTERARILYVRFLQLMSFKNLLTTGLVASLI